MRYALLFVAITVVSWFQFDGPAIVCLAAEQAPQQGLALAAKDTIFLREGAGETLRE